MSPTIVKSAAGALSIDDAREVLALVCAGWPLPLELDGDGWLCCAIEAADLRSADALRLQALSLRDLLLGARVE